MRFHIVGIGAVGSLFAHSLRRSVPASHSVVLVHKRRTDAARSYEHGVIKVENNHVVTKSRDFLSESFEGSEDGRNADNETIESLFITTKAHQTLNVVRRMLPRISPTATIVLMQNGMGILEELIQEVFTNPNRRPHFILASNTHGVHQRSYCDVIHAGVGSIDFGIVPDPSGRQFEASFQQSGALPKQGSLTDITFPDDKEFPRYQSLRSTVAALLLTESLNCSWKPIAQVELAIRRKLVVNSVVNPLTALIGCRNGEVFSTLASRRIRARVCQEASLLFAAQSKADNKIWMNSLHAQGIPIESYRIGQVPRVLTKANLENECTRVALATKDNISSMLADIKRGKTTEIDYLNGYLLSLAATYNVYAPAISTLRDLIVMRTTVPLDQ